MISARLLVLTAVTSACFSEIQDRDCDTALDCFEGETCTSGRCVVDLRGRAEAGAGGAASRAVEVYVFGREGDVAAATVEREPGGATSCHCPASSTEPCRLEAGADEAFRVCARAHGHVPCAEEVPDGLERVEIVLEPCAGEPCDDAPGACDCAGLPLCGR